MRRACSIREAFCDDCVVLVYDCLNGGRFDDWIEVRIELCDLDDICCNGLAGRRRLIDGMREQRLIELLEVLSEVLHVFGPIFVYPNLVRMLICEDEILEELVLKLCRGDEVLSIRSNFWFQTYQVEVETLAVHNTLHYICEIGLATTREEDREGIFLLDAQLDELDLQLVNTFSMVVDGVYPQSLRSTSLSKL